MLKATWTYRREDGAMFDVSRINGGSFILYRMDNAGHPAGVRTPTWCGAYATLRDAEHSAMFSGRGMARPLPVEALPFVAV